MKTAEEYVPNLLFAVVWESKKFSAHLVVQTYVHLKVAKEVN